MEKIFGFASWINDRVNGSLEGRSVWKSRDEKPRIEIDFQPINQTYEILFFKYI